MGPTERACFSLRTPVTTPIGFIKPTQHKPPKRVYKPSWCCYWCPKSDTRSFCWAHLSRFYRKTETESILRKVVFFKQEAGWWIMSKIVIVVSKISLQVHHNDIDIAFSNNQNCHAEYMGLFFLKIVCLLWHTFRDVSDNSTKIVVGGQDSNRSWALCVYIMK
jgi:hypothetical protein